MKTNTNTDLRRDLLSLKTDEGEYVFSSIGASNPATMQVLLSFIDKYVQQRVSETKKVLKDIIVHAAEEGVQDKHFVGFYVLPTGPIHRGIAYFNDKGGASTMGDVSVISQYQSFLHQKTIEAQQEIVYQIMRGEHGHDEKSIVESLQASLNTEGEDV